jgi:hypothetical protein
MQHTVLESSSQNNSTHKQHFSLSHLARWDEQGTVVTCPAHAKHAMQTLLAASGNCIIPRCVALIQSKQYPRYGPKASPHHI